ncbi:hypothetical protein Tco_1352498 [Tanacetum coccineum]
MSTNSSTQAVSSDVAELKDMVRALILDRKNQTPVSALVKAVEESCVTCGGAHSYQSCPATDGNWQSTPYAEPIGFTSSPNLHVKITLSGQVIFFSNEEQIRFLLSEDEPLLHRIRSNLSDPEGDILL